MNALLLAASVVLLSVVPVAAADADLCTLPPVSQWQACVENGCAIVDGPAIHREVCAGPLIGDIGVCTPGVSQWRVCLDLPCSSIDGPAIHRDLCIPALA